MNMTNVSMDRDAVNRELVDAFARKAESVAKWSDAMAYLVLWSSRRDEQVANNRAARAAGEPEEPPRDVTPAEMAAAAEFLGEVQVAGDIYAVTNAVAYCMYTLPSDFVRKLADRMAAVLSKRAADATR